MGGGCASVKCVDVVGRGMWEAGKMASYLYHLLSLR